MKTLEQSIKLILSQLINRMKFQFDSLYEKPQIINEILQCIDQIELCVSGKMNMSEIMRVVSGVCDNDISRIYDYNPQYFLEIKHKIKTQSKDIHVKSGSAFAEKIIELI